MELQETIATKQFMFLYWPGAGPTDVIKMWCVCRDLRDTQVGLQDGKQYCILPYLDMRQLCSVSHLKIQQR